MRVYHAVNGQVQFKQTRGYLSLQCRLRGLQDRVIIVVDASDMTVGAHNDIWKGDREAIRKTSVGNMYLDKIQDAIRTSEALKEYQDRVVREETEQLTEEAQTDLFQSLVEADPNIAQLLPGGTVVRLRNRGGLGSGGGDDWEGRYHPTFVRLVGRTLREEGIEIEADDRRRVRFETDAANNWLVRPDNRGSVALRGNGSGQFSIRTVLRDGSLSVTIQPVPSATVIGTELSLDLVLHDDGMPLPLSEALRLRVVEARPHHRPGPPNPPNPPGPIPDESEVEQRGLPPMVWLTRDGRELPGRDEPERSEQWPDGFTDQDGGVVDPLSEDTTVFKLNYDNAHFQQFLNKERSEAAKRVVTEQYRMSMLVLMMGFEEALSRMSDLEAREALEEHVDYFRSLAARGAATVVMSIARTLPQLITPDTVGDPDDD